MKSSGAQKEVLQEIVIGESASTFQVFIEYIMLSPILEPDTILHDSGLLPTRSWRKNDIYPGKMLCPDTKTLVTTERKRHDGLWALSSKDQVNSRFLEEHAEFLLDRLEPCADAFMKYIECPEKYVIKFHIWWECQGEHGGFQLTGRTLMRMSKLCHFIDTSLLFRPEMELDGRDMDTIDAI